MEGTATPIDIVPASTTGKFAWGFFAEPWRASSPLHAVPGALRGVIHQCFMHITSQRLIDFELACFQLCVENGIFFVNHLVRGDVRSPGPRLPSGYPARPRGFGRNGKHQVDVHVIETGLAEHVEGAEHHIPAVHAPELVEQGFV
jgi:hypothetical protein